MMQLSLLRPPKFERIWDNPPALLASEERQLLQL